MYERVIVPTDGSEIAEIGVEEGLEVAKRLDIPALCIYVIDFSSYDGLEKDELQKNARRGMEKVGERALRSVRKKAHEMGVEIQTRDIMGTPYKRIVEAASERDIIYICSHGKSGFSEYVFGSTTERVIKHADCTVAVVKAE